MGEHKIHVLDFEVANLIAAGEVVDRPASVIKELLENAIDSGANIITVEIKNGGVTYMRVTDNGCGIDFDDLPTAILRHATSKIRTSDDLDSIGTLGFRGEALAAIASVSKLRIISRPADSPMGGILVAEGGEIVEHAETGCSAGTNVIVEELFSNVPARRKFLKKDTTEAAAIGTVVERIALSRPDISFRFINNGEIKLRTEGNGDLSGAIYSVLGRDFRSRTILVDYENAGLRVTGYIGMPDTARANRNGEIFFINGRYIRSGTAGAALEQAYRTYIPDDRFPSCVLSLYMAPNAVDVNVHPAKLEVKFSNEKLVFETFYYAVRPAIERNMKTNVLPVPDAGADTDTDKAAADYMRRAQHTANAFVPIRSGSGAVKTEPVDTSPVQSKIPTPSRETFVNIPAKRRDISASIGNGAPPSIETVRAVAGIVRENVPDAQTMANEAPPAPVSDESDRVTLPVPEYTIIGEAWDTYVIVLCGEKLYLIDKHAAHERILFEQMRRRMRAETKESPSQMLLVPVTVRLTREELDAVIGYGDEIRAAGFDFTVDEDASSVSVSSLPEGFSSDDVSAIFETLGGELTPSAAEARDEIFERALYTCACKAAIKGGRVYGIEHIKWLCDELFRLPDIKYCPHGRPVAFELPHSRLDRYFGRTE